MQSIRSRFSQRLRIVGAASLLAWLCLSASSGGPAAQPPSDRHGLHAVFGEAHLAANVRAVRERAAGLLPEEKWPRGGLQRAELTPGGRTIRGTIVSTAGQPLAGAKISSGLNGGYAPSAVTDENGRFELHSLPENQATLYPTIELAGYVKKERFAFQLEGRVTDVKWELAPE